MKLSDVGLFLIVLFTLVLITSGGRNLLQSSPQHQVINPRGSMFQPKNQPKDRAGCWECWEDEPND
ncbi:hypothetical protein HanXRQr2_Chr11g0468241 [Helianthus annuus]|uniref:Uncharacterized protein n=1 Tax=Helianthus annuus TaxID=4232 RepID=A0A251T687_HELAN|nr:hypothetical protein HanXRQr2_Chr11g0468241 [Helianthus annuus]